MIEKELSKRGFNPEKNKWVKGNWEAHICRGCGVVKFFNLGVWKRNIRLKNITEITCYVESVVQ